MSEQLKSEIIELLKKGESVGAIANAYNVCWAQVEIIKRQLHGG